MENITKEGENEVIFIRLLYLLMSLQKKGT